MLRIMLVAATMLSAGTAFADEVVIHRDTDAPPPPSSSSTTVEKHTSSDGCASKSVHKENDAGDSKTVQTTSCD